MNRGNQNPLEQRIVEAAEAALMQKKSVSAIDVLVGIRWLPPSFVDQWRQGRLPYLEEGMSVNSDKLSTALNSFRAGQ